MVVLSPAGVRADDVLVAACVSEPGSDLRLPTGFIEIGRSSVGDQFNGGLTTLIVAYHVLSATENADTTYTFEGPSSQIVTVAYRNASRQQPFAPAKVSSIQSQAVNGDRVAIDVPPLLTRSSALPLYVFAIRGTTSYPVLPGLDLAETTNGLAAYRATTASPAAVNVPGPHLEIPVSGAAPSILVASLAAAVDP